MGVHKNFGIINSNIPKKLKENRGKRDENMENFQVKLELFAEI
jgi:hypothetical protein